MVRLRLSCSPEITGRIRPVCEGCEGADQRNASVDERGGKLLFSKMTTFDEIRQERIAAGKELWLRFTELETYMQQEQALYANAPAVSGPGGREGY